MPELMTRYITARSMFSGKEHTLPITAPAEEWAMFDRRINGEKILIQVAMPSLTPDQREFLMTGVTPEEWKAEFGEVEGDK